MYIVNKMYSILGLTYTQNVVTAEIGTSWKEFRNYARQLTVAVILYNLHYSMLQWQIQFPRYQRNLGIWK